MIGGTIGNLPGAILGGIVGALIGAVIAEKIIDIIGNDLPYPLGPPNTTVRGDTKSRSYHPNGYPDKDVHTDHHTAEFPDGHVHDWRQPEDGTPPRNSDRSKQRDWKDGDPAPPRFCPK